jgi:universal stress protein A
LCPIDFSDNSRFVVEDALAIAAWYESTVTVLHVTSPASVGVFAAGPRVLDRTRPRIADREQVFAWAKAFAGSAPGISMDAVVREGDAVEEVMEQVSGMKADLIVLGTHGRVGIERLGLGSVAETVLRRAGCPVMTVPRDLREDAAGLPAVRKRILCPVDFSDSSLHALKNAVSMAQEAGGLPTVLKSNTISRTASI